MKTLGQIKAALLDRKLKVIAEETGIHYNTLRTIRDDPNANPTYKVVVAISEYLERK